MILDTICLLNDSKAGGLKLIHPLLNKIPVLKKEDRVGQRSAQNCYNYVNVSLAVAGTSRFKWVVEVLRSD